MPKSIPGRVLFRKIKGRIVPIKITNRDITPPGRSMYASRKREITAWLKDEKVGKLELSVPRKGVSATLDNVSVGKEFRRRGISKNLFQRAVNFLQRANFKFLRSDELLSPAQVKIRRSQGVYRITKADGGYKRKLRTRFFADQFGPYGEQTRRITSHEAIRIIKENKTSYGTGRLVTATTFIKRHK